MESMPLQLQERQHRQVVETEGVELHPMVMDPPVLFPVAEVAVFGYPVEAISAVAERMVVSESAISQHRP
jgi:hypothetical protein